MRLPLHLDVELGDHLFKAWPLLIRGGEPLHGAEGVLIAPKLNAEPVEPIDVEGHVVRNHELRASESFSERIASIICVHPIRIHHQLCNASQLGDKITHRRPRLHERGPGGNFVIALIGDEANLNHRNIGLLAPDAGRLKVNRHPTLWESTTKPVARLWKDHAAIMRLRRYYVCMSAFRTPHALLRLARGRAAEILVLVGAGAILACDLLDPTLDARIYAASEHALGSVAWLFHTGLAALFVVLILLSVRLRERSADGALKNAYRGVLRGLVAGAIGVIGVVAFPTDPGWGVVSVPGRLHPMFALLAAGSLLYVGSRLTRPRSVLLHTALFIGAGFVGGFVGGGAGFAERFALAVVGLLLYLGAYRSRIGNSSPSEG